MRRCQKAAVSVYQVPGREVRVGILDSDRAKLRCAYVRVLFCACFFSQKWTLLFRLL